MKNYKFTSIIHVYAGNKTQAKEVYADLNPKANAVCEEVNKETENLITITVKGGIVEDVAGLPDGYDYVLNDLDLPQD